MTVSTKMTISGKGLPHFAQLLYCLERRVVRDQQRSAHALRSPSSRAKGWNVRLGEGPRIYGVAGGELPASLKLVVATAAGSFAPRMLTHGPCSGYRFQKGWPRIRFSS